MNVKQVIEEETERSPFYSRRQLFTFHISFAHNLFSLYISFFNRTQPVFTLHFIFHSHVHNLFSLYILCFICTQPVFTLYFAFHSHTPCFHFTFRISFAYNLCSLYISNFSCVDPVFPFILHFVHFHPVFT